MDPYMHRTAGRKRWKCKSCGYIQSGDPPASPCPICGVPGNLFAEIPPEGAPQKWRCRICGLFYKGDSPPETCPACGSPSDQFDPIGEDVPLAL